MDKCNVDTDVWGESMIDKQYVRLSAKEALEGECNRYTNVLLILMTGY